MVVVHRFTPALAVGQEVAHGGKVFAWDVCRLEVDRVQTPEDAVVGEGHLGRDIVCSMGGLCRSHVSVLRKASLGSMKGRTSLEKGVVEIREYGWSAH